jgi:hypothetical protein
MVCHTGDTGAARPFITQTMTHILCLDGCQTFGFTPNQFGVSVLRKALNGRTDRWQITGNFQMTREEARNFWKGLIKDGAFRA